LLDLSTHLLYYVFHLVSCIQQVLVGNLLLLLCCDPWNILNIYILPKTTRLRTLNLKTRCFGFTMIHFRKLYIIIVQHINIISLSIKHIHDVLNLFRILWKLWNYLFYEEILLQIRYLLFYLKKLKSFLLFRRKSFMIEFQKFLLAFILS